MFTRDISFYVKPGPGSLFNSISQEHLLSFPVRLFLNLNIAHHLNGKTVWFSPSEVVSHSNTSEFKKKKERKLENNSKNVLRNA